MTENSLSTYPASNPEGQSKTKTIRMPPEMLEAICEIVESGATPWEDPSAFIRGAIGEQILRIKQVIESDSSVLPPILALIRHWSQEAFKKEVHEKLLEVLARRADEFQCYLDHEDLQRALVELEMVCDEILNLKDIFWRDRCLEELFSFSSIQACLAEVPDEQIGKRTTEAHRLWVAGRER